MAIPEVLATIQRQQAAKRSALTCAALLIALLTRAHAVGGAQQPTVQVISTLQTIAAAPAAQQPAQVYTTHGHIEAPNWTHDGASLIFDQDGALFRIPVTGGTPQPIPMGDNMHCNGSHGLSPDGTLLAVSCSTPTLPGSHVYVLPSAGGTPRLVTGHTDSYFHTWSPDGSTIVFTRPDHGSLNLFAINAQGGAERPLTTGTGISDDPDFSPDGKYLYFCSDRGGSMQIWRMHPDGTAPEQMTNDDQVNWTPHPSPDGRWIVFLTYAPGTTGHPANQPVSLRLLSVKDRKLTSLVHLTGGAGTINVPSWAPDSRHLAYVSYRPQPN